MVITILIQKAAVHRLKLGSLIGIFLTVCIFLTFYFVFLAFQYDDGDMRVKFMTFATTSLIVGVTVSVCLVVFLTMRKLFQD